MSASKYSAEFKEQVVLEIVQRSRPVAEVARSYGLVPQTVGNWVAKWRTEHPEPGVEDSSSEENAEPRRHNKAAWTRRSPLSEKPISLQPQPKSSTNNYNHSNKPALQRPVEPTQYVSLTYHQHLVDAGIVESTGSVGDSYDNALAENVNGSYKNEIIHTRRWADVLEVEIATFEWVNWWNTERLHQALDYRTPAEVETDYWQQHQLSATTTNRVNA